MKYNDFIRRQSAISFAEAIELLTPIFMKAIEWNPNNNLATIRADQAKFIENEVLLVNVGKGNLAGKIIYSKPLDADGDPTGEPEYLNKKMSYVDCKQLLAFVHAGFIRNGYSMPAELEELLNIKQHEQPPEKEPNHSQNASYSSDEELPQNITKMTIPALRKKVVELTNEKDKWDKSIVVAAKIGLLFYEKELSKPTTEKEFVAKFAKEFDNLPKKTISMIYKALPSEYRNKGGSPQKDTTGIDDETIDMIIEAAVAAGLIIGRDEVKDAKDLSQKLTRYEFETPPEKYLRAISGTCKRVHKKFEPAVQVE